MYMSRVFWFAIDGAYYLINPIPEDGIFTRISLHKGERGVSRAPYTNGDATPDGRVGHVSRSLHSGVVMRPRVRKPLDTTSHGRRRRDRFRPFTATRYRNGRAEPVIDVRGERALGRRDRPRGGERSLCSPVSIYLKSRSAMRC
ncbi:hypothetical protein EVAR_88273_1 [Eumeta japonica]|uniref:Uncharacterized protein n=1 Tax=Eumeta variegata TaxID=151549 RepID=A0A4C1XMG7_EUMVA|nr:hypothetical protein EVAR_88273_1 [Eumeta japonica]